MTIKVMYFAWVKQKIGMAEEVVSPPEDVRDVGALMTWLSTRSSAHAEALNRSGQVRAAVNHEFRRSDFPVKGGDEVAFFPPVTGG
ncbi:molybdopterin converting factor subunit 1 [Pseudoroseomonas globiformis]|uniref:Molybdopterin synthase sulfur carrier subunit n=1 Tax=Teichococcus globiformis TaxID=2307229 RepID=A0ABV7G4E6_9PROT